MFFYTQHALDLDIHGSSLSLDLALHRRRRIARTTPMGKLLFPSSIIRPQPGPFLELTDMPSKWRCSPASHRQSILLVSPMNFPRA